MADFRVLTTLMHNPDGRRQATGTFREDGSAIVRAISITHHVGDVITLADDDTIAELTGLCVIESVE